MIFDGQQCAIFGTVKTTIQREMKLTKDSAGYPKWYDYGAQYDTTKISFSIISDTPADLEKIIREQYTSSSIAVTFESGEWLYDYTGNFTIQKSSIKKRLDYGYNSYRLELTIAPIVPLDYTTLTGDRTPCDGAGYMVYSGVKIPQPREFKQKHNTHKYTGTTHGSSYSSQLQTIEHDETSFTVDLYAGAMRGLVDKLYTSRGNAVQFTFPANTYTFGLARGGAESVGTLCIASDDTIEIESSDSFEYSVKMSLIALEAPIV